jgi:hypothetical protein
LIDPAPPVITTASPLLYTTHGDTIGVYSVITARPSYLPKHDRPQAALRLQSSATRQSPPGINRSDSFLARTFMGFYEEIAIMINSALISADLGYWTIGLDASNFYNTEQAYRDDRTWTLFNSFAQKVAARYHEISPTEITELNLEV